MSRAVKTVVAVAAAVAVPFAAPAIAAAVGLSAAIGATAGAAVVGGVLGAGVGAAGAALTGGNIGRGALIGGAGGAIGGGMAGYSAAPVAGVEGAAGAATAYPVDIGSTITTTPLGAAPSATLAPTAAGSGLSTAMAPTTQFGAPDVGFGAAGAEGVFTPTTVVDETSVFANAGAGGADSFGGSGIDLNRAGGVGLRLPDSNFTAVSERALAAGVPTDLSLTAGMAPSVGINATPSDFIPTASYPSAMPTGPIVGTAAAAPSTFTEALARVPAAIATRFTDPNVLADLVLRAGGQLAGSAIAGDGLTGEEKQLLDAQTEELRNLQQTNQELFNQKLEAAQALIGESKYFDPEYFGLQRARRAQVAGARAKQAGLRGLTGERRQAEARRYDLATGRDVGTAFDVGYGTGIQGRLQTQQAGLAAFPQPMGYGGVSAYNAPINTYGAAQNRVSQTQQNIGQFIGDITGRQSALSRGGLY